MAPTLIASELFGHERGAFTGAHARARRRVRARPRRHRVPRRDRRAAARPAAHAARRARAPPLQAGGRLARSAASTCAWWRRPTAICATPPTLGTFRADLYFRLAVARVVIPPLRERPEDIEPLVRHFAEQLTGDPNAQPFDRATLDAARGAPLERQRARAAQRGRERHRASARWCSRATTSACRSTRQLPAGDGGLRAAARATVRPASISPIARPARAPSTTSSAPTSAG